MSDAGEIRWTDEAYWRGLLPALHIEQLEAFPEVVPTEISPEEQTQLERDLVREGYIDVGGCDLGMPLEAMATGIETLVEHGIQPTFAFIYDEYWQLYRNLDGLLRAVLGEGYLRLPDFWAFHVPPGAGNAGWGPHRDRGRKTLLPDGRPISLTVWVPLTESTPLNGCIYVVPARLDPAYHTGDKHYMFGLESIRALPAEPGTILCWNQNLMHWGARSSHRARCSRISLAVEFQRADTEPFNAPLMPPEVVPAFPDRLSLIGRQFLQYQHMYTLAPEVEELANQLTG